MNKIIFSSIIIITLIIVFFSCSDNQVEEFNLIYVESQYNDTLRLLATNIDYSISVEKYNMQFSYINEVFRKDTLIWTDSLKILEDGIYRKVNSQSKIILPNGILAHVLDFLWVPFNDIDTFITFSDVGFGEHSTENIFIPIEYLVSVEKSTKNSKMFKIIERKALKENFTIKIYLNMNYGMEKFYYNDYENGERNYTIIKEHIEELDKYSKSKLKR